MNQLVTLLPGQIFYANDRKSNFNTLVFSVPSDRDQDDPFYIIPEIETDEFVYWTGGNSLGENVQYFYKKP